MSVDISGFDASKVDPFVEFQPVPAGEYLAALVESELKDTKDSTGKYINAKFQIIDGPHKGVHVYEMFNLVNKSEKAVEIGQAKLSGLCRSVGVLQPKNTSDLYNKPVVIKVTVEKRQDKENAYSNRISEFKAAGGVAAGSLATPQSQAQPAGGGSAFGGGKKPWEK